MSVLACNRGNCENIMCDRLSHDYGYICNECFAELCGVEDVSIVVFMSSNVGAYLETEDERTYEEIFPYA